jgi:hypothetical protein
MKKLIIIILSINIASSNLYAQFPCYGLTSTSACCNGIINTDKRGGFTVNQDPNGILNQLDWTKKQLDIIRNPFSTGIIYESVMNPFYRQGSAYDELRNQSFNLNVYALPSFIDSLDFHAKDGWQLLHAHFNYQPDFITKVDFDNERRGPYFILYNKYTGRMRFIYNIKENNNLTTRGIVNFGFYEGLNNKQSPNYSALLANYYPTVQTLSDSSLKHTVSYFAPPSNEGAWSYGDFDLGYDPCVCSKDNSDIYFYVENQQSSEIQMVGKTIGKLVSVDGSGNPAFTFGKNWFANIDANGNNIEDGLAIYDNATTLAEQYKIKDQNFFQQHILGNISTIISTGASLVAGPLSGVLSNYINDFTGIVGKKLTDDEIKGGITATLAAGGKYLNTTINAKKGIPNIMFMESFSKFSGTVKGRFVARSFEEVLLKNPGSIGSISPTLLWKNKPFYNEPLGVFALLEKPKLKRKGAESIHNFNGNSFWTVINDRDNFEGNNYALDVEGYEKCYANFKKKKIEFSYELAEPIKFVFNPSAEVDLEKSQISAMIIIPTRYSPYCEGSPCGDRVSWSCFANGKDQEITGKFCGASEYQKLLTDKKDVFSIIESSSLKTTYVSPLVPINHFNNLRFNLTLEQNGCTKLSDIENEILVRLELHIVHKPNIYGEVKEELRILTYDADIINTQNLTKPSILIPFKGKVVLSNYTYTKDTIIYADTIIINGFINSSNGAKVTLVSKNIYHISGAVDPFSVTQLPELYPSVTLTPQSDFEISEFCNLSNKYKANKHPLKNVIAKKEYVKNQLISTISLHPNPTSSKTTLTLSGYENTSVSVMIFDLVGREVYTQLEKDITAREHQAVLNTETLQAGTYIVKVFNGTEEKIAKLVILKN